MNHSKYETIVSTNQFFHQTISSRIFVCLSICKHSLCLPRFDCNSNCLYLSFSMGLASDFSLFPRTLNIMCQKANCCLSTMFLTEWNSAFSHSQFKPNRNQVTWNLRGIQPSFVCECVCKLLLIVEWYELGMLFTVFQYNNNINGNWGWMMQQQLHAWCITCEMYSNSAMHRNSFFLLFPILKPHKNTLTLEHAAQFDLTCGSVAEQANWMNGKFIGKHHTSLLSYLELWGSRLVANNMKLSLWLASVKAIMASLTLGFDKNIFLLFWIFAILSIISINTTYVYVEAYSMAEFFKWKSKCL